MPGQYSKSAKMSSRGSDDWVPWREPRDEDCLTRSAAPKRVVLERSGWAKFLAGTPVAIPAQFNRR